MKLREEVFFQLIQSLNQFQYCILRNYQLLPSYVNDIDILIAKHDKKLAIQQIELNLKKLGVFKLKQIEFSCTAIFFYDEISQQYIHIDFYDSIRWHVFKFLNADEILKTKLKFKSFYIPNKNYECLELLLTRLLYHGKIKESYKEKIFELAPSLNEFELKYCFNKKLIALVRERKWSEIEKQLFFIRSKVILQNIKQPIILTKSITSLYKRFITRIYNYPGLFIAFYGVDGSGKSTQIKLLTDNFCGLFFNKIKLFHFRPNFIYKKPDDKIFSNPHDQLSSSQIRSILKLIYYIFIYNWGFITQILPVLFKGGIVIFDRYYMDMVIDPKRYRMFIPVWFIRFCERLVPKTDLNILLVADSNKIYERKTELHVEEIENQQKIIFNSFAKNNDFIVHSDQNINHTVNDIKNIIINYAKTKT